MSVRRERLNDIYANSDDPWQFDTSPYEQEKFRQTAAALSSDHYSAAFEFGCGNGALARHLSPRCARYVGFDAVDRALSVARRRVPQAVFVQGYYPCPLPEGPFDLLVLSEILYFLSAQTIEKLAADLVASSPAAEVMIVTYLGDTAHELQGEEALQIFCGAMVPTHDFEQLHRTDRYRIDRGLAKER